VSEAQKKTAAVNLNVSLNDRGRFFEQLPPPYRHFVTAARTVQS